MATTTRRTWRDRSRAAALARPGQPFRVTTADLRRQRRRGRESNLVILLLDTSGSMATQRRNQTVVTVALSLLADSYLRPDGWRC